MAPRTRRAIGWTAAVLACSAVFALYTRPAVVVMLADQLWSCFH